MSDYFSDELSRLFWAVQDGEATSADIVRLEQLVREHAEIRTLYIRFVAMSGVLRYHRSSPHYVPVRESNAAPIVDSGDRWGLFADRTHGTTGHFLQGISFWGLIAVILAGIATSIIFLKAPPPGNSSIAQQQFGPVGRITGMVDCKWAHDGVPAFVRDDVLLNRQYKLDFGLMEITYDTGAKVVLQGPATYDVDSASGGYLAVGKLTARLEKKVESGKQQTANPQSPIPNPSSLSTLHSPLFTIKTPLATVTDLGTEFGIDVQKSGATTTQVFSGAVELQPATNGGPRADWAFRLIQNQAADVERRPNIAVSQVRMTAAAPERFVRPEQFSAIARERQSPLAHSSSLDRPITDKTFVAWVSLDTLDQRGVGIISLFNKNVPEWDGIVYGELEARKWLAGSHEHVRTQRDQSAYAAETASPNQLQQIAIAYKKNSITIYRNGEKYAAYDAQSEMAFDQSTCVLIGKRHLLMPRFFDPRDTLMGAVEEARLYNVALSQEAIASLRPNVPSPIAPIGQWTFEDGTANDSMGVFPAGELHGNAKIVGGKLVLDGADSYLLIPPTLKSTEQLPDGAKPQAESNREPNQESGSRSSN